LTGSEGKLLGQKVLYLVDDFRFRKWEIGKFIQNWKSVYPFELSWWSI